ncbi:XRE family transcriptional regulator [Atopobacter sp. AH10]|uniref:helix-turn-helix domain-containing protein n=1 Tax=Atopobacter sp. AH10 TaxID=2315861 RepID=UPI000EF28C5C|nr:helix-turn-helix transcriptional regulator [Atopobacter sp. AH10]RLK62805.1 XRE family transcriptional regulator [Atopobacter sp. AH10]
MENISPIVGDNIRFYRKRANLTQESLGLKINKGKATVAKYESGQIILDIQTLFDIAQALEVTVDQLLYIPKEEAPLTISHSIPNFFRTVNKFYVYFYDGRNKSLNESVLITKPYPQEKGVFEAKLYFNISDVSRYQLCEYTYVGRLVHYDVISIFSLQNKTMAMEELKISIPASYNDEEEKFALFSGISSRPLMPVTFKILVSKRQKTKNKELIRQLKISTYDLQMMKFYNMFTVI